MAGIMTVSEVREIYPRPEGAAVQKRWRKLDRFMSAFIKRSPFLCLGTANAAGALSQRRRLSGQSVRLRDNRSAAKGHAFIPPKRRLWHSRAWGMSGIGAMLPLPPRARKGLETAQPRR
jgi:hypothetical protein